MEAGFMEEVQGKKSYRRWRRAETRGDELPPLLFSRLLLAAAADALLRRESEASFLERREDFLSSAACCTARLSRLSFGACQIFSSKSYSCCSMRFCSRVRVLSVGMARPCRLFVM